MRIVLLENVEHLGIVGDIKEVAPGYARNFLLPQKLAVKSQDKRARILLKDIAKKREKTITEIKKIEKLAKDLEGKEIKFSAKVNEKGKLFAAITAADIAKKLALDKKQIQSSPIKDIGTHKIKLYLGHNIKTSITIEVEKIGKKTIQNKENNEKEE